MYVLIPILEILAALFFWWSLVFALAHTIVPGIGLIRIHTSNHPPDWVRTTIDAVRMAPDQTSAIRIAYDSLLEHYYTSRIQTITKFRYLYRPLYYYPDGHVPCTHLNQMLADILVASGRFQPEDIHKVTRPFNLFVHQYLQIKLSPNQWIDIDPGGASLGRPFGHGAVYFG